MDVSRRREHLSDTRLSLRSAERHNQCVRHVACRTAAAKFHKNGDMTYREMNSLPGVKVDHVRKKAKDGLSSDQMVAILEAAGARCIVADYTRARARADLHPFQKYIYGSIESGYPVIVFFGTKDKEHHAIPVFGHTFCENIWPPSAQGLYFRVGEETAYIPSESWLGEYIGHDDNCGSNFSIPRDLLYTRRRCTKRSKRAVLCGMQSECVAYIIATMPKETLVNPIDAEVIGAYYLFRILCEPKSIGTEWGQRLKQYADDFQVVLRPVLLSYQEYVSHLALLRDWERHRIKSWWIDILTGLEKSKMWMVEFSVPELFSTNRRKLGEILLRTDIEPGDEPNFGNWFLARMPDSFVLGPSNSADAGFEFMPSGVVGHVPLFGCERWRLGM